MLLALALAACEEPCTAEGRCDKRGGTWRRADCRTETSFYYITMGNGSFMMMPYDYTVCREWCEL